MARAVAPLTVLALLAAAGCAKVEPQFQAREGVENLIDPAEERFVSLMDESFGSPSELVAWETMPVHFHGGSADAMAVEGPDGEVDLTKLELDFQYQSAPVLEGQKLTVTLGPNVGVTRTVAAFDEESSVVTLAEPLPAEVDGEVVAVAPGMNLKRGQKVYAQHCLHCHGISGDGNGPTADSMTPRPRDYRNGEFKFTSTQTGRRASREDFLRILDHGVPGTYMPSFKLMPEADKKAVTEYVRWLAMRGETEKSFLTILETDWSAEYLADFEGDPEGLEEFYADFADYAAEDIAWDFADEAQLPADKWVAADLDNAALVPETPRTPMSEASVARGRQVYLAEKSKCASCHGDAGLGNGPSTMDFLNLADGSVSPVRGLYDSWGNVIQPRNLTKGQFRGGRRPIDIYRRIHAGIKGTPMSAFGTVLSEEEIWDLVNYVIAIGEDPQAGMAAAGGGASADEVAMR